MKVVLIVVAVLVALGVFFWPRLARSLQFSDIALAVQDLLDQRL